MAEASRRVSGQPSAPRRPASVDALLSDSGKFPREARVRRRKDFLRIQKQGYRVRTSAFTVIAAPAPADRARLGCVVSKKVGKAPTRARVKRLLRETFRRMAHRLDPFDIVIVAKPNAAAICAEGLEPVARIVVPAVEEAARRAPRGGRSRR